MTEILEDSSDLFTNYQNLNNETPLLENSLRKEIDDPERLNVISKGI